MKIGHLQLPIDLVSVVKSKSLKRETGSWQLKSEFDSYDNPLETELGQFLDSELEIVAATKRLSEDFSPDGDYGYPSEAEYPGGIPDIVDFSDLVCFGASADGSPFCLDYRESKTDPSVVWWDDIYWRKISPSFSKFLALLEINC